MPAGGKVIHETCTFDDCGVPHYGRGLCQKHYSRWHRYGDTNALRNTKGVPLAERFWPKVDKSGGPDACWPWLGGINGDGYGFIRDREGPA